MVKKHQLIGPILTSASHAVNIEEAFLAGPKGILLDQKLDEIKKAERKTVNKVIFWKKENLGGEENKDRSNATKITKQNLARAEEEEKSFYDGNNNNKGIR